MEKEIAEYTQKMKELQAGIKHSEVFSFAQ